jgi:enolase-phosphatase E1
VSQSPALAGVQAILLDIEGTTTPISFVAGVLFPYARRHLRRHLDAHASAPEYARLFDALVREREADFLAGEPVPSWNDVPRVAQHESVVSYVEWLMDRDRKSAPLKTLQGWIWQEGYTSGELVGDVFDDVPRAFAHWQAAGLAIGIFSSGSVLAQQLLFRHSSMGDLTPFLSRYFDTTTGPKFARESYARIAEEWGVPSGAMLFVSDSPQELDAARGAGVQTRLAVRPGNVAPPPGHAHRVVRTFEELEVAP